jgi:membrane protein DedA with SNARE-associated domain
MIELLSGFIIHLIQSSGYFGVFLLMTLESALIPIPSEVTMPFAGFLVTTGEFSFTAVVLIGALGNLVGSWIGYAIGYFLEETIILTLIKKYGKFILVTTHEYEQSLKWFNKFGDKIAFFSRMLPAVRTFISLPCGLAEMNFWKFSAYTFFGSLIWSALLTYVGVYLGSKWNTIGVYFHQFDLILAVLLVFAVLFYINHKLKIVKFSPRGEADKK